MKPVRAKGRDAKSRRSSPSHDGHDATGDEGALGPPIIRLALENWPAGAVLIDRDGCIIAANRAAAKLFGYSLPDLHQVSLSELIPDWRPLGPVVARGESLSPRATRRSATGHRLDGASFPLRYSQLLVEADSALWTLVSVSARGRGAAAQDVPDQHSPEERLRAAVKAGGIGTWIWDLRDRTVWWDDAMYELWGRRRQEEVLPAATAAQLIHPDDQQWAGAQLMGFLQSDAQEFSQEFRVHRPDKVLWVAVTGRIERDEQGQAVRLIGATIDVTARKQAEESLRHAQKIEALGTLAGGIAHDFNNILLAIAGNTRLAMTELPPDHPVQQGLNEIATASARASDLVNRILTFSRQGESRREVISLQPAVEEAVKLLRATLPAMVDIRCHFTADLPLVRADATQIHQIVINLLTNSAHAIGDEAAGVITVELDEVRFAQSDILMPELKAGRYVRLSVSDTGCGMDKATLDRAFDPFFTTKPPGRGTGLGLSVVHGIVRNHEGAIIVSSEPGRGSTFRLYFPVIDAPQAAMAKPANKGDRRESRGDGRRVMYIDDEEALVFLMSRVLQRAGYEVTGFSDPEQALQVLQARARDFDVVVTDLSMPGMSGFHLARAIKEFRADLPIVVTSGYLRAEDREVAREIGIRDLVLKPDTVEELGQVLERVFER